MLYKVTVPYRSYGHEVVKDGGGETFVGVRLLRYWQIELMEGR